MFTSGLLQRRQKWLNSKDITTYKNNQDVLYYHPKYYAFLFPTRVEFHGSAQLC